MEKTRLSENGTQSMHPDKMGALIHRKIKNVDISLDQRKKTILPKVCTLTILGSMHLPKGGHGRINALAAVLRMLAVGGPRFTDDGSGPKRASNIFRKFQVFW